MSAAEVLAAMEAQSLLTDEQRLAAAARLGLQAARTPEVVPPPRPKAAPAATARPGASEAQVLSAVLGYLRRHPAVAMVWRQNVGAMEDGDGRFVRFGFAGMSDVMGVLKGGRALFIEVKREKGGRLSDAQRDFLARMAAAGALAGVVRSVEETAALMQRAHGGAHGDDGNQG